MRVMWVFMSGRSFLYVGVQEHARFSMCFLLALPHTKLEIGAGARGCGNLTGFLLSPQNSEQSKFGEALIKPRDTSNSETNKREGKE